MTVEAAKRETAAERRRRRESERPVAEQIARVAIDVVKILPKDGWAAILLLTVAFNLMTNVGSVAWGPEFLGARAIWFTVIPLVLLAVFCSRQLGSWSKAVGLNARTWMALIMLTAGVIAGHNGLWEFILDFWEDISYLTQQHLYLVLVSGGIAVLVGVPLGVLLSRPGILPVADTFMQAINVGATVPTLAIIALAMTLFGIGATTAMIGLFFVTLLPIVRNTFTGITGVSKVLKEAATGQGLTKAEILWFVELPNALFVIFAGVRTAMAINVGSAPLAFLISGGGLGEFIFTGIDLSRELMLITGALLVALIAILVDFILGQLQYWLVPRGVNPLR